MDSNRTKASGPSLTLITGLGGRPVSRQAVERYCLNREIATARSRPAQRSR